MDYDGTLLGGNCIIRRDDLARVGPYNTSLHRAQDHDMYLRLLQAGAKGKYMPDLIILHLIHPSRATKAYFRRWCFVYGRSMMFMDRAHPQPVARLFGIPRYVVGAAIRKAITLVPRLLRSGTRASLLFDAELDWWTLAGFVRERIRAR